MVMLDDREFLEARVKSLAFEIREIEVQRRVYLASAEAKLEILNRELLTIENQLGK